MSEEKKNVPPTLAAADKQTEIEPNATQPSAEACVVPLDSLVLNQITGEERKLVRDHAEHLAKSMLSGSRQEVLAWIIRRIASEDSISQLYAARREVLFNSKESTRVVLPRIMEFDKLVTNSHHRLMNWLEILRRFEQNGIPTVRIQNAGQVAILGCAPSDLQNKDHR